MNVMKIAIDIGHANNTGACGNGLEEHAVAKAIGEWLAGLLRGENHDVNVIDYPTKTNSEDINSSIAAANAGGYDFGISIHCDASDNPAAKGAHVCFYPGSVQGSNLAVCIADPLCRLLPGRANSVMSRPRLTVLKKTNCPWVLVECGFITNKDDADIMKHHPESIAEAIAEGVLDFLAARSK